MRSAFCIAVFVLMATYSQAQNRQADSLTAASGDSSRVIAIPLGKGEKDGSSFENAIFINKSSETEGVAEEYKWVKAHILGAKVVQQATTRKGKKQYDILTIKTVAGTEEKIYFDITKFYGKF
ncbi:MAG: hypothetical protein J7539_03845 [Niabella sp.]|nr:hypothetical protein [Niabella sp.]